MGRGHKLGESVDVTVGSIESLDTFKPDDLVNSKSFLELCFNLAPTLARITTFVDNRAISS